MRKVNDELVDLLEKKRVQISFVSLLLIYCIVRKQLLDKLGPFIDKIVEKGSS